MVWLIHGILIYLHDLDPWQMLYWMLVGALFHSVLRAPIKTGRHATDLGRDRRGRQRNCVTKRRRHG